MGMTETVREHPKQSRRSARTSVRRSEGYSRHLEVKIVDATVERAEGEGGPVSWLTGDPLRPCWLWNESAEKGGSSTSAAGCITGPIWDHDDKGYLRLVCVDRLPLWRYGHPRRRRYTLSS